MFHSSISSGIRQPRVMAAAFALCWLLLAAPTVSAQQEIAPDPAAPPAVAPEPAPKAGPFEAIGRWFDQSAANFRDHLRGAKRKMDDLNDDAAANSKGFSDDQAAYILTAALTTPSHLTTAETCAAPRWVPWTCAYSGARVNEVTSLLPADARQDRESGIRCF